MPAVFFADPLSFPTPNESAWQIAQPGKPYLIHEFPNLSWITEINELFHDILIYWDAPVHIFILNVYSVQ